MALLPYRTWDGVDDLLEMSLAGSAGTSTSPNTYAFLIRLNADSADGEIIHTAGYDPLDIYYSQTTGKWLRWFNGVSDGLGPGMATADGWCIFVLRAAPSTNIRYSKATWNGSAWSSFTHTNDASVQHAARTMNSSGGFLFGNSPYIAMDMACCARWERSLSDAEVANLTTDFAAWQLLQPNHLWALGESTPKDYAGLSKQASIVGTTTSAGAPLDYGTDPGLPTVVSAASAAIATRSPSVTFDTAAQTGDVVVLFPASTATGLAVTVPAGWVNVLGGTTDVESDSHQGGGAYHVVTSGEAGTTTWTLTNWFAANQTGAVCGALIRSVDGTTPLNIAASTFNSTNTVTPHVLAGLTPTTTDGLILSFVAKDATGAYSTTPAGYSIVTSLNTNQGVALLRRVARSTSGVAVPAANITPSAGDEYLSITAVFTKGSTGPAPQTWTGSTATVGAAGVSGSFIPGDVTWTGSVASVGVAGVSGEFTAVGAPQTWTGSSASVGVAGVSGSFTPGVAAWAGSSATVGATATSGSFVPGVATWAGSTVTAGVAATSGSFVPGSVTWPGSAATIGVAGVSGEFLSAAVWVGSTAELGAAGQSGSFIPGAATWTGSVASIGATGVSGSFVADGGPQTWTGSTATVGASAVSGTFTPGAAVWVGSAAQVGVSGTSGTFTPGAVTWTGSTATIGAAGVSGSFSAGGAPQTWVGSAATVGIAGTSGSFTPGPVAWIGSTAEVGVAAQSGVFLPGLVTWAGSTAAVSVFAQSGLFFDASLPIFASILQRRYTVAADRRTVIVPTDRRRIVVPARRSVEVYQ